jgi:hypothetical protein
LLLKFPGEPSWARSAVQLRGRYNSLFLDPLRRSFTFILRTIHREYRNDTLLLKPPYAEAFSGEIPAMNEFICSRCIAPVFIGEIKYIRKEIGDMLEWSLIAHKCSTLGPESR